MHWLLSVVLVLQMLTAPIAAHMVGRAGYRTGDFDAATLVVDELAADVADAGRSDLPGSSDPNDRPTGGGARSWSSGEPPAEA